MVARTRLIVTLYVHCLYCLFQRTDKLDTWTFPRTSLRHCIRHTYFSTESLIIVNGLLPPANKSMYSFPVRILSRLCSHWLTALRVTGVECPRRLFLIDPTGNILMVRGQICKVDAAALSIQNLYRSLWSALLCVALPPHGGTYLPISSATNSTSASIRNS